MTDADATELESTTITGPNIPATFPFTGGDRALAQRLTEAVVNAQAGAAVLANLGALGGDCTAG